MLCAVYKSSVKEDTYLYVEKRDDFEAVPDALLKSFGTPQFVMLINLAKRDRLAGADIEKVRSELSENGFYLQIPPPKENLLDALRKQNGVTKEC